KATTQKGLVLSVGDETVLNFSLEVGTPSQELVVSSEAPIVNTTTASLGGLVNEQKLAELPLNGRNYLDLTLLQPGISQNTVVIQLGGGAGGTIYSSNGAPIISNNFLLDGTPTQNVLGYNGASVVGTTLGLDGIREYKVITNAFSAEYGMNMGSQMTIVSKGGSNQFHGDVFEYLRNRVLTPGTSSITPTGTAWRVTPTHPPASETRHISGITLAALSEVRSRKTKRFSGAFMKV
ncbi:MAG: hypothetical protein DMG17_23305, partial [Acidobacteria bacterium]